MSKIRCIDGFAQSLINDTVNVGRRIRVGSIPDFVESARRLHAAFAGHALNVMRSDFQAASRSCPIRPDHVPLANILIRDPDTGEVPASSQWAMPYAAVSAVYAWDRLVEALTAILRRVFLFPASRYVDDLFMPAWASISEESRGILLEVVDVLEAVLSPAKTLPPAPEMPVLGVFISVGKSMITMTIEQARLDFWKTEFSRLRQLRGPHRRDLACRMAGRLEFAASAAWGAAPRARFNGLYTIAKGGCGCLSAERDDEWLLRLMDAAPPLRYKTLTPRTDEPIILYTDASGHPKNGLGAVLMDGDSILWTKVACPEYLLESGQQGHSDQPHGSRRRHPRPLDV